MLTGGGGGKICQNLADVICERSLTTIRFSACRCCEHALQNAQNSILYIESLNEH